MGVGGHVTTLVCLGFGYSAQHYVALHGKRFDRIVGTTRSEDGAKALSARRFGGKPVEMLVFDGNAASPMLAGAVADATLLLDSISPDQGIDPVLGLMHDDVAAAPRLASV